MRKQTQQATLTIVRDLAAIPAFATEAEEAAFWSTHALGEGLFDDTPDVLTGILPPPRPETQTVSIRIDEDTLQRLKHLARLKRKGYQALLKEFVVERLYEEEKRAGVLER